jgi:hypothetical protein
MILDTMTYSVIAVIAVLSFVVILLARSFQGQQDNSDKK